MAHRNYHFMLDHFVAPEARVKRAGQLIGTLERQLQRWANEQSKFLGIQPNPDDGKLHLTLTRFDGTLLTRMSITMGEIAYNLRSALDFTVYELAVIGTGSPVKGTQFPIEDSPAGFQMRVTGRDTKGKPLRGGHYLKGVPKPAVALIRDLQPFAGCAWTRELRDLSNPDKHRHLPNLGTHVNPTILGSTLITDPDTGHQSLRAHFNAEVEVVFADQRPVLETHQAVHREVKAAIAVFKNLAKSL